MQQQMQPAVRARGYQRRPLTRYLSPVRAYDEFERLSFKLGRTFDGSFLDSFFGTLYVRFVLLGFLSYLTFYSFIDNPMRFLGSGVALAQDDLLDASSRRNQIVYLALVLAALPLLYVHRRRAWALAKANAWLILLLIVCLLSATWADAPETVFKRGVRYAMGMTIVYAVVAAAPSKTFFLRTVLALTVGIMVADLLAYTIGRGFFDEFALFRGVHGHKNSAGAFGTMTALLWLFVAFGARRITTILFCLLMIAVAIFVVIVSGSKTQLAVLPVAIAGAAFIAAFVRRGQPALIASMLLLGTVATLTVLVVVMVGPLSIVEAIWGDPTMTGRTRIWAGIWPLIQDRPLLGYGFGGVWRVDDGPLDLVSDERIIVFPHAHNGYLGVVLELGIVGLVLAMGALLTPFQQLFRVARVQALARNVGPFAGLIAAAFVHNLTEATFVDNSLSWTIVVFAALYIAATRLRVDTILQRRRLAARSLLQHPRAEVRSRPARSGKRPPDRGRPVPAT